MINVEAVTPGELKRLGDDLVIRYGLHPSPFGDCLLAVTDRGDLSDPPLEDLVPVGLGSNPCRLSDRDAGDLVFVDETLEVKNIRGCNGE